MYFRIYNTINDLADERLSESGESGMRAHQCHAALGLNAINFGLALDVGESADTRDLTCHLLLENGVWC